jgi:hypothetical protein
MVDNLKGYIMHFLIGFVCLLVGAFAHAAVIPAVYNTVEVARQLILSVLV